MSPVPEKNVQINVYVLKAQWAEPFDVFRANVQSVRL